MALKTFGTLATNTLRALQIPDLNGSSVAILAADLATLRDEIFDDFVGVDGGPGVPPGSQNWAPRIWPGSIDYQGGSSATLSIPNRGTLKLYPGDWIVVETQTGWVFVVSGNCVPSTLTATGTTTNNSATITFTSSIIALGWAVGMPITGTNVPAGSWIATIAQNGLSLTLGNAGSNLATGGGANTMTVSNFTHN